MTENYFNTKIVDRHDDHIRLNNWMAEFMSFCMEHPWNTDEQREMFRDEKSSYICYDVWVNSCWIMEFEYNDLETFDFVCDDDLFDVFDQESVEAFDPETYKLLAQFWGCPLNPPQWFGSCIVIKSSGIQPMKFTTPESISDRFYLSLNLNADHGDEIFGLSIMNRYIGLYSDSINWGILDENGALWLKQWLTQIKYSLWLKF